MSPSVWWGYVYLGHWTNLRRRPICTPFPKQVSSSEWTAWPSFEHNFALDIFSASTFYIKNSVAISRFSLSELSLVSFLKCWSVSIHNFGSAHGGYSKKFLWENLSLSWQWQGNLGSAAPQRASLFRSLLGHVAGDAVPLAKAPSMQQGAPPMFAFWKKKKRFKILVMQSSSNPYLLIFFNLYLGQNLLFSFTFFFHRNVGWGPFGRNKCFKLRILCQGDVSLNYDTRVSINVDRT